MFLAVPNFVTKAARSLIFVSFSAKNGYQLPGFGTG